jgi:phage shock protein PspC (stress-responsive transcriptional regulator)
MGKNCCGKSSLYFNFNNLLYVEDLAPFRGKNMSMAQKRLYRSRKDRFLGGVCGGFASYFNIDPTFVRLIWVVLCLAWGAGLLLYIIAWIIIPLEPQLNATTSVGGTSAGTPHAASSPIGPTPRHSIGMLIIALIGVLLIIAGIQSLLSKYILPSLNTLFLPFMLVIIGAAVIIVALMRR